MAQDLSVPAHRVPAVVLAGGDDASGLASMLADLLTDNVRDFPWRARVASRARGSVVLRAADHDLEVTVAFLGDCVEITDGAAEGVTTVSGPWLAMAQLCSGQLSAVQAVRRGELAVRLGHHLPAAAAAGFVLSVPESFYAEGEPAPDRRSAVAVGAVVVAAVAVGVAVVVRRRTSM